MQKAIILGLLLSSSLAWADTVQDMDYEDTFEPYNRAMFSINEAIDKAIAKPVATAYQEVMPDVVQIGVSNVFGNLGDVSNGVNNLLQGKPIEAFSDLGRLLINSTIGIYGIFDVASHLGLEKHDEDFGQTLGVWGVPAGDYIVLPLLGPSTLRDTAGKPVDYKTDVIPYTDDISDRNSAYVVRGIANRAELLAPERIMEEAALDKYSFVRDAYLQNRNRKVQE